MGKIEEFFDKKLITNYNTRKSYRTNINKYFKLVNKDINTYFKQTPDQIEKDLETAYKKLITNGKELLVIRTIFNSIKQFLCKMDKRLKNLDFWDTIKDRTRGSSALTDDYYPNVEDIKQVLQHSNTRARAMFLIQSCTGCRIGELIALYPDDIKIDENPVRIEFNKSYDPTKPYKIKHFTKTKTKRNSFLTQEATESYKAYMKERDVLFKKVIKKTRAKYRPVILTGDKKRDEKALNEYINQDNRVFPISDDQARGIWARMVEKSGLYKKDSNTNRLTLHPHCLRKFFRSYLGNSDFANHLMGHSSGMDEFYRGKKIEDLGKEFMKYMQNVTIFETESQDIQEVKDQLSEKDKQIQDLKEMMDEMKAQILELRLEKLEKKDKILRNERIK